MTSDAKPEHWWAGAHYLATEATGSAVVVAQYSEPGHDVAWYATDLGLVVISERRPNGWIVDLTLWPDVKDVELRVEAVFLDTTPGPGSGWHLEYRMSLQYPRLDVAGSGNYVRTFCDAVVKLASAMPTHDAVVTHGDDEEVTGGE